MATSPTESQVWDALGKVTDPEYPLSVVDLGMVYGVSVVESAVKVEMTFTSIGCPAIEMIISDMQDAIRAVPGVRQTQIDVTWSPPWTRDCISDRGRRVLAMYGVVS